MRKRKKRGKGRTEDAKDEMRRLTHSAIFTEGKKRRVKEGRKGKEKGEMRKRERGSDSG